jgi:glutamine synthetase
VLLGTGLDGLLSDDTEIVAPTDKNVYQYSTKDLEKEGIISLPGSLRAALNQFKESDMMMDIFGEQCFKNYYYAKLEEYDEYRIQVSDWERNRYITRL